MKILDLIKELKSNGIDVSLHGNDLKVNFSGDSLPTAVLARLKENKEAIIGFLRQDRVDAGADIPALPPQDSYQISSAQGRMWVLSQFEESNVAYNMLGAYVLEGQLDTAALDHAFAALIERHEMLRTVFREDGTGQIRQIVRTPGEVAFEIAYLDVRDEEQKDEQLRILIGQDSMQAFNLAEGPLLRANVYQLADDKWVLAYVMHHIISDGWSMDILLRELMLFYNAHCAGTANPLPPLQIQYKDYAAWQQAQLGEAALGVHKAYWLEQFAGELPVLEMPIDRVRPAIKTYNGGSVTGMISPQETQAFKALIHEQGGTLFMGLMALVNTLLYRYTSQEDIVIGTPIACREHTDLENQIGLYLNTLALRTRFKGDERFTQLMDRVKKVTLDGYQHQVYPFDELVSELDPQRGMSRDALFDVLVVLQNTQVSSKSDRQQLGGLKVSEYERGEYLVSKFELTFTFIEQAGGIKTVLEYNSDLYKESTAQRLSQHFGQLLSALTAHPHQPIAQLEYLSGEEKRQLEAFNDTAVDYPEDKTLVSLFEQQVERTPDNVALVFEDEQLTYRELNEKANQLAHYLREHYRLEPEDRVGILLERSEWMMVALLGVLKAGGAYVPMDLTYPQERIDYLLSDSACKVLLDQAGLDRFTAQAPQYGAHNPAPVNTPSDLAYVIYTSGSTGQPKGVMVCHRGVVNLICSQQTAFGIDSRERILQFSNLIFDASVEQIWLALLSGAALVLVSRHTISDKARFNDYLLTHRVTHLHATPSFLEQIELTPGNCLRRVIAGGEECKQRLAARFNGPYKFYNEYGPTETTVTSIEYLVSRPAAEGLASGSVAIGKPITNTSIYILDDRQALCPVGVIGEICISGAGLARGYLNHPGLTAEKFVPNPYRPGEYMFRTGDTGRWLADGNIDFRGRKDDQVKLRGYRIELGEIEVRLRAHPFITAAVLMVRSHPERGQELVAYVVSSKNLVASELRSFLGWSLPAYMLPDHFVQLDALPLTTNGKVDKKALPAPDGLVLATGVAYVAPRNETEEKLLMIWQQVLGREGIGITDNFFDLGGNSIKLVKMVGLVNSMFEEKVTIVTAFRLPTVKAFADYFHAARGSEVEAFDKDAQQSVDTMFETFRSLTHVTDEE